MNRTFAFGQNVASDTKFRHLIYAVRMSPLTLHYDPDFTATPRDAPRDDRTAADTGTATTR